MTITVVVVELLHEGGVVVFRGKTDTGQSVRAVASRGVLDRAPQPGETWELVGEWQTHPTHGRQIAATTASLVRPNGALIVQALARSARFPGIGPRTAQRLWDSFGLRLFEVLDAQDASAFHNVLELHATRLLLDGWRELDEEAKAYRWLTLRGFPASLGHKVIAIYKDVPVPNDETDDAARIGRVAWHLESDPYRMLAFAPWRIVDPAARALGVLPRDPRRLVGAVEAVLSKRLMKGHTWMESTALASAVAHLLRVARSLGHDACRAAVEAGAVATHASGLQLLGCYVMERFIVAHRDAVRDGHWQAEQIALRPAVTPRSVLHALKSFDRSEAHSLTREQRRAVWMALKEGLSCLIGGPGVGKTTVLKAVHRVAEVHQRRVVQAALAGRAAQRMAETTGRPAWTIAKLLLRVEFGEETLDDEPLVIIDEASMVDLPSLYRMLRVMGAGADLLLVGDPGQLPPVGFGLTFHRLAEDPSVPRTVLRKVLRQTDASGIPAVCRAIREGTPPTLLEWSPELSHGVSFVDASRERIAQAVLEVVAAMGPNDQVQVVGSVRQGIGTVTQINYHRHQLAAIGQPKALLDRFYPGEPVIATRNAYDVGVMNGELGTVVDVAEGSGLRVRFDREERVLPMSYLEDLELAYAITCHKSQGSQFRRVVVPVTPSRLLDRTLLLTAVSRAQEQVVLVGDRTAFNLGVTAPPLSLAREIGLGYQ